MIAREEQTPRSACRPQAGQAEKKLKIERKAALFLEFFFGSDKMRCRLRDRELRNGSDQGRFPLDLEEGLQISYGQC
jgi:hypothetical protein